MAQPLVLVSNRGPVTYQEDGSPKRGTGGLVTALTGLASHRDAIWIASAMTDEDVEQSEREGGRPFEVEAPEGGTYQVRFVASDPEAYDRFYNIFANPMLWFIQHYLWDQSNAPDIRRHEVDAYENGYQVVNRDLATAVLEEIEGQDEPVVMVHDYQLYTLPAMVRAERPDVFLHHFVHIPWTQSDAWRVLPSRIRDEIFYGLLANDIIGFHTRSYRRNFLQCCRDLLDLEVDMERGVVRCGGRDVWVRAYPLPIDYEATRGVARREGVRQFEGEILRRRREFAILRVDRADLSKNVLRGFTAFDIFLEQHPEFAERITFTAQLMPSRTDVPEYAEYLEKIEALVAVVNHRHGTPDWMPIDLKLRDDLEEAVASYKHYDVMMVNAMFDGMNLVAKEGPLVNERNGVSILSENTGAHEELGEFALSVNPFDVQELADAIYSALTMSAEGRARRASGSEGDRHVARSGRLDRRADRGHPRQGARGHGVGLAPLANVNCGWVGRRGLGRAANFGRCRAMQSVLAGLHLAPLEAELRLGWSGGRRRRGGLVAPPLLVPPPLVPGRSSLGASRAGRRHRALRRRAALRRPDPHAAAAATPRLVAPPFVAPAPHAPPLATPRLVAPPLIALVSGHRDRRARAIGALARLVPRHQGRGLAGGQLGLGRREARPRDDHGHQRGRAGHPQDVLPPHATMHARGRRRGLPVRPALLPSAAAWPKKRPSTT